MKQSVFAGLPRLLILFAMALHPLATSAEVVKEKIRLGTATQGGGFQVYGFTLAEVVNAGKGKVQLEAIATRGSRDNLRLLEAGEIDIGLVEGNAARQALEGLGRSKANLKVISVMYPNPGMFVVRADSPYFTIKDLKGKPVVLGTRSSGLRILANDVLDGLGLNAQSDFQGIILDKAADGPRLVLEKKAEALWGAGTGWPGFVKVANSEAGARFIAPTAQEIKKIHAKHPHLKPMTVPAGTYKGQTSPIDSVGMWSMILVRPDLSEELVYELVKAIHAGEEELASRLPQASYTRFMNTVQQVDEKLMHAGFLRYYGELENYQ